MNMLLIIQQYQFVAVVNNWLLSKALCNEFQPRFISTSWQNSVALGKPADKVYQLCDRAYSNKCPVLQYNYL